MTVSNLKKAERKPLHILVLVQFFTLFVFLFGSTQWVSDWDFAAIVTVGFVILYFFAFFLGYVIRMKGTSPETSCTFLDDEKKWLNFLKYTIYINLLVTVLNAFLYTNASGFYSLFQKAITGLTSPGKAYYAKDTSSKSGSLIVLFTFVYSPVMYLTNIYALYRFKSLNLVLKICVVSTLVIEAFRWLAIGTNKGLFDIVLLFITLYIIMRIVAIGNGYSRTKKEKRKIRKIRLFIALGIIAFFVFFATAISSRVKGAYNISQFSRFPYNLIPENLRFFVSKFESYLCQGYSNLIKILRNCEFRWTYGAGNSRFLMSVLKKITGVDLTGRTYPYQLNAFGVDPLKCWHTAYAWFASDVGFIGVALLMFLLGFYTCGVVNDIIKHKDPLSMTMLFFIVSMIMNSSCTNYVLAYSNGFSGFWIIFVWRMLRKKRIVFTTGKIRFAGCKIKLR